MEKQRVPRGRPKIYDFETKEDYHRAYYQKNKERWNADFLCPSCNLYCSLVNKNRHIKSKHHLKAMHTQVLDESS